jgi:hypothetical protein
MVNVYTSVIVYDMIRHDMICSNVRQCSVVQCEVVTTTQDTYLHFASPLNQSITHIMASTSTSASFYTTFQSLKSGN